MGSGRKESRGLRLRAACAAALARVVGDGQPAPAALEACVYGGARDERDRGLAKEIVMGVLRWKGALEKLLALMSRKSFTPFKDDQDRMVMLSGMYQILMTGKIPDYAAVSSTVELIKGRSGRSAASFANAVLRRCAAAGSLDRLMEETAPGRRDEILWACYPSWLRRRLEKALGKDAALAQAEAMNRRPETFVRVDGMEPGEAGRAIEEGCGGAEVRPGRWLPSCLIVRRGGDLHGAKLFLDGLITVQDEASQIAAASLAAGGKDRVLDCCCGMGIKAGQIGLRLGGGAVAAFDRNPAKVAMLLGGTARLKVGCVRAACADAAALPLGPSASFERILVDAPCTGTGSMARKPEIRHRLKASDPARLSALQGKILESASRHLRGGGVLVYSACSLLPEEGIGVVERFLGRNPAFTAISPPGLPPSLRPAEPGGGLLMLPSVHGAEGFFIAALTKT